jgi:hypothetical protein
VDSWREGHTTPATAQQKKNIQDLVQSLESSFAQQAVELQSKHDAAVSELSQVGVLNFILGQ